MQLTPLDLITGLLFVAAASIAGGYFGGTAVGGKALGRDLSGFLGMLYGPPAGAVGVIVGVVVVALLVKPA